MSKKIRNEVYQPIPNRPALSVRNNGIDTGILIKDTWDHIAIDYKDWPAVRAAADKVYEGRPK